MEEKESKEVEVKTGSSLEKMVEGISIVIAISSVAYLTNTMLNYFR